MGQAIFEVSFQNGRSKVLGMRMETGTLTDVDGGRWAEQLAADMPPSVRDVQFRFFAEGMVWDCSSNESAQSMMEF